MNEKDITYCIVSDGSGHRWICPTEIKDAVEKNIQDIERYWSNADYEREPPEELVYKYGLELWEGEDITFTNPKLNGKAINITLVKDK